MPTFNPEESLGAQEPIKIAEYLRDIGDPDAVEAFEWAISACACIGPAGDCPCIRTQRGLPQHPVTETQISADVFAYLTEDEKKTINELKQTAFARWWAAQVNK